ncbi:spore gernimation protein, partial [Sulfobacillus sp. DSM 109850]|nr:spore gernimation protein [Sulfobacillus harzensis]
YLTLHVFVLTINLQDGLSLSPRGRVVLVWSLMGLLGAIAWRLPSPVAATDLVVHWIDPAALGVTMLTSLGATWLVRRRSTRESAPVEG